MEHEEKDYSNDFGKHPGKEVQQTYHGTKTLKPFLRKVDEAKQRMPSQDYNYSVAVTDIDTTED